MVASPRWAVQRPTQAALTCPAGFRPGSSAGATLQHFEALAGGPCAPFLCPWGRSWMQMAQTEAGESPDSEQTVPPGAPWCWGSVPEEGIFRPDLPLRERRGYTPTPPGHPSVPVQYHKPARQRAGGPSGLTPTDLRGVSVPWVSGRVSFWSSLSPRPGDFPERWVSMWSPLSSSWSSQPRGGGWAAWAAAVSLAPSLHLDESPGPSHDNLTVSPSSAISGPERQRAASSRVHTAPVPSVCLAHGSPRR